MSDHVDVGMASTLFRVKQWLTEREQLTELGEVVHIANGHVLRMADLKRLVDRLDSLPEVNCGCHNWKAEETA